jgi:hypothetical protein
MFPPGVLCAGRRQITTSTTKNTEPYKLMNDMKDALRAAIDNLAQRELVHAKDSRCTGLRFCQPAYQPQQRRSARSDVKDARKPGAGPARQHQGQLLQYRVQPGASPSVSERQPADLFGKRGPRAGEFATSESPDL